MSSFRSAVFSISNQALRLTIVLAGMSILGRLLEPSDFGKFGIAYALYALLLPLLDFGLTPVFLKQNTESEGLCNALFTIYLLIGLCALLVLLTLSQLMLLIYNDVTLPILLAGLSMVAVLQCYLLQPSALLMRRKQFGYLLIADISGLLLGIITATVSAYLGMGVWSLLLQQIVAVAIRALLVMRLSERQYRLVGFKTLQEYGEIMAHGVRILAARFLGGLAFSLDKLILGKLYTTTIVGYYSNAMQVALTPDTAIRTALTTPALSHIASFEGEKKAQAYLLVNNAIIPLAGIPCLILIVVGDAIMPWFLGDQWTDAGIYLQILGFLGLGRILHGLNSIINMNELSTRFWLITNLFSTAVILIPLLIHFLVGISSILFVTAFSISYVVFWLAAYSVTLVKLDSGLQIFQKAIWSLFVTTLGGLFFGVCYRMVLYQYSAVAHGFADILTASLVVASGALVTQYLLNRKQCLTVIFFLKDGLRRFYSDPR